MKKIFSHIGLFIICFFASFFLFFNYIGDILYRFMVPGVPLYLSLITFTAYILFIISNFIIYKKINRIFLDILAAVYFIVVLGFTFNKIQYSGINVNPFTLINDFNEYFRHTLLTLTGNLLMYLPLGIYSRYRFNIKSQFQIIGFLIYIILVECIQYFMNVGILDINDILANTFGFICGVFLYQIVANKQKNKIDIASLS